MELERLPIDSKERQLANKILDAAEEERGLLKHIQAYEGDAAPLQTQLEQKRAEIKAYLHEAVSELGMADIPMIKHNYKKYVGEELPQQS